MKTRELDLYTLNYVKERFILLSDVSTKCQGFQLLERLIEEEFNKKKEIEKLRNK